MTTSDLAQPLHPERRRDPRRALSGINTAVTPQAAALAIRPPADWPGQVPFDPLLTAAQAARLTGLSRTSVWSFVRDGRFPAPVYLAERMPRWRLRDLEAHIAALPRAAAAVTNG